MAYVDFAGDVHLGTTPVTRVAAPPVGLTPVERDAVSLARTDRLSSIRGIGYPGSAIAALFGLRRPNRLADSRLETLRRFSVAVAHGSTVLADREQARVEALGFTHLQVEEARSIALRWSRKRHEGYGWVLFLAVAIAATARIVDVSIEDPVMSFVIAGVVIVQPWAAVAPRRSSGRQSY